MYVLFIIHLIFVYFYGMFYLGVFSYMPIVYKIDVLAALKTAGYSTYRIRKEKILGEATLQKIRNGESISWENMSTICKLLNCQPGDIVEYKAEE